MIISLNTNMKLISALRYNKFFLKFRDFTDEEVQLKYDFICKQCLI